MSLHVLEFNDLGLRLSDANGLVLDSPGYANIKAKEIEFGDNAYSQSKVNPLSSFNQFWHKLSLDPFAKPVGHFRHNADIAFSHLQDIAEQAQRQGDVVLALPSSFSREQMAILLGLMKQSAMRPVGIVDAALMASIDHAASEPVIHVDLQLHQIVLSKLQRVGNSLKRESAILVPGTGWVNICENLMQLLTSAFIQQCRFNPQHNAQTEQLLLDSVPQWLSTEQEAFSDAAVDAEEKRRSLQVKLTHNDTVYQAALPHSSLIARLQPFFHKIQQQLALLDTDGQCRLLVSDRLQNLPGFHGAMSQSGDGIRRHVTQLQNEVVATACLRYQDFLVGKPEALHFVSQLVPAQRTSNTAIEEPADEHVVPTHGLIEHSAQRLQHGLCIVQVNTGNNALQLMLPSALSRDTTHTIVGEVQQHQNHFVLANATTLHLNDKPVDPRQPLHKGDRISLPNSHHAIQLIRVQEDNVQ